MVVIVDYKAGNIRSVERALRFIGADHRVSDDPAVIAKADRLIFPGVGHAKSAMDNLRSSGLDEALQRYAATGRPFLGICLGSQIILDQSEEGDTQGLGLLPGRCRHFQALIKNPALKIPHMGWNTATANPKNAAAKALFAGIAPESSFYFVHSYYTEAAGTSEALCQTDYGASFASGLSRANVAAVQFHPEKSGVPGLRLLQNFMDWQP